MDDSVAAPSQRRRGDGPLLEADPPPPRRARPGSNRADRPERGTRPGRLWRGRRQPVVPDYSYALESLTFGLLPCILTSDDFALFWPHPMRAPTMPSVFSALMA